MFPKASAGLNLSGDVSLLDRAKYCSSAVAAGAIGLILKALPKGFLGDGGDDDKEEEEGAKEFMSYLAEVSGKICHGKMHPNDAWR